MFDVGKEYNLNFRIKDKEKVRWRIEVYLFYYQLEFLGRKIRGFVY